MSASMKAYLAANYMSGPKADAILARTSGPKRKKRKTTASGTSTNAKASSSSSSMIKDDDILGWGADPKPHSDEEDTSEAVVASDRRFKKKQRAEAGGSGWATVRPGDHDNDTPPPEAEPADEQPLVIAEEDEPFKGGLMTTAQMKKTFGKSRASKDELSKEEIEAAQETIYRDASGQKIDTAVERASAARRKREKEEREAKKMEWGKGLVQREEVEKKRKEAEDLKGKAFARGVDDVDMNAAMKAEERWNDPAAAFLSVSVSSHFVVCLCCVGVRWMGYRKTVERAKET
ncbi:hypothetical protein NLI96_g5485 [Meripilus lineatus]|uniref:Uncharacterized protein n=1 Tax=Meripilus lineatus TaxID=2056292 RepID=A0AAD5YES6_9APHY|nr:hypothetical protein NLI96_g5485 [Physisporinus lineatus]